MCFILFYDSYSHKLQKNVSSTLYQNFIMVNIYIEVNEER